MKKAHWAFQEFTASRSSTTFSAQVSCLSSNPIGSTTFDCHMVICPLQHFKTDGAVFDFRRLTSLLYEADVVQIVYHVYDGCGRFKGAGSYQSVRRVSRLKKCRKISYFISKLCVNPHFQSCCRLFNPHSTIATQRPLYQFVKKWTRKSTKNSIVMCSVHIISDDAILDELEGY